MSSYEAYRMAGRSVSEIHMSYCCVTVEGGQGYSEYSVLSEWQSYYFNRKGWKITTHKLCKYLIREQGYEWIGAPYDVEREWRVAIRHVSRPYPTPYDFVQREVGKKSHSGFFGKLDNFLYLPTSIKLRGRKGWKRMTVKAIAAYIRSAGGDYEVL